MKNKTVLECDHVNYYVPSRGFCWSDDEAPANDSSVFAPILAVILIMLME